MIFDILCIIPLGMDRFLELTGGNTPDCPGRTKNRPFPSVKRGGLLRSFLYLITIHPPHSDYKCPVEHFWELSALFHRSAEHEAELKALKFRAQLQRKGCRGRPLTSWEKQGNRTRSKTRSRIEHVFGAMVQRAGNVILRTIGIKAAEVKLGLRNLAYNMDRYCTLMLQAE